MQKAFEESRNRMRNKLRKEKEEQKKQERLHKFANIMFFVVMIMAMVGILAISGNMQNEAIKNCEKNGYSYNYCINHS